MFNRPNLPKMPDKPSVENNPPNELDILLANQGIIEKVKELEIQKLEKEIELEKAKKSNQSTLVQKGIFVALIGLVATLIGAVVNGAFSRQVEQDKYESELISKALASENEYLRNEALDFLSSSQLVNKKLYEVEVENFENIPKILEEFNIADVSNLDSEFAIKTKFNYTVKENKDSLIVSVNDCFIAFLRNRPLYPTIIKNIQLFVAYYPNSDDSYFVTKSKSYFIGKKIEINNMIEVGDFNFSLDISELNDSTDYFIGMETSEYYNGVIGYSTSLDQYPIRIERNMDK